MVEIGDFAEREVVSEALESPWRDDVTILTLLLQPPPAK